MFHCAALYCFSVHWNRFGEMKHSIPCSPMDPLTDFFLLSSQDVNWWTGVVWITCGLLWWLYQLFGLSFWRHPFTEEHHLPSKWSNDTFLQISKKKKKKKTQQHCLHLGCAEGEDIFSKFSFLGWTVPLQCLRCMDCLFYLFIYNCCS